MEIFRNQSVFLDTSPFIYYIEEHPQYLSYLNDFFIACRNGDFSIMTSAVTLIEVLVVPIRRGNIELAREYEDILRNSENLELFDITIPIAQEAARLRATYNLRTPDAIQIATAVDNSADLFLTNDIRLQRVREIQVLVLGDLI